MRQTFLQIGDSPRIPVEYIDGVFHVTAGETVRLKAIPGATVDSSTEARMIKLTEPVLGYDQEFLGVVRVAEEMWSVTGDYKLIVVDVVTVFPAPAAHLV